MSDVLCIYDFDRADAVEKMAMAMHRRMSRIAWEHACDEVKKAMRADAELALDALMAPRCALYRGTEEFA